MDGSRHRIRHSGESRNPEGEGGTNHTQTLPPTNASNFHTLVCRRQPAWAIGTKACPGLRPGMDGSRHRIAGVIPAKAGIQGGGWRQPHPNTSSDQVSFSYLGVPAPADMSDWCESMSRTPTRDGFRHRPATPTTVARTTTAEGRKRDVALGLAPCRRVAAAGHCHYGPHFVIPAKAGIQGRNRRPPPIFIPQCAGGNRRGRFLWNLAPPRLATD